LPTPHRSAELTTKPFDELRVLIHPFGNVLYQKRNIMGKPNLTVDNDMVITVDYVLTLDNGDVVEDTHAGMPMRFLAGHDEILPALEDALFGLAVGDETAVTLAPDDAYGDYDPEAFEEAPVDAFPANEGIEPGMPIGVQDESGEMYQAFVSEVRPDIIVLDFNHPLAGETLHFQVKVIDLRPATAEELDHGHIHGDGHEHHE
jgi:FKBP-type peptidyl-prolyl cis-trans isomerase SlyD